MMEINNEISCGEDIMGIAMSSIFEIIDRILSFLPMKEINKCAILNSVWNYSVLRMRQKRCKFYSTLYQDDITKNKFKEKFKKDLDELWITPCCFILFFYPTRNHGYKWNAYRSLTSLIPKTVPTMAMQTYGIINSNCITPMKPPLNSIKCELIALPIIEKFSQVTFYIFEESATDSLHKIDLRDSDIILNTKGVIIKGNKNALFNVKLFLISFDKNFETDESDEYYINDPDSLNSCQLLIRDLMRQYQAVVAGYICICPKISSVIPLAQGIAFCGPNLAVSSTVLTSHISSRSRISHSLNLLKEHFNMSKIQTDNKASESLNTAQSISRNDSQNNIESVSTSHSFTNIFNGQSEQLINDDSINKNKETTILCTSTANENILVMDCSQSTTPIKLSTNVSYNNEASVIPNANKELLSFAFMISCVNRPDVLKKDNVDNIDLVIFKEKFPNLPVFGYLAGGELGHNHIHNYNEKLQNITIPFHPGVLSHTFSTIFVILSVYAS